MKEPLFLRSVRGRLELDFDGESFEAGQWIDVEKKAIGGAIEFDGFARIGLDDARGAHDSDRISTYGAEVVNMPRDRLGGRVEDAEEQEKCNCAERRMFSQQRQFWEERIPSFAKEGWLRHKENAPVPLLAQTGARSAQAR